MDAITLLKDDHKMVKELFRRFDRAKRADDLDQMQELCRRFCAELEVHSEIEETIFYPAARPSLDDDEIIPEAEEEHHVVDVLMAELSDLEPADERYVAKATVLMELVKHHIDEEEQDLFPKMRSALGRTALVEMGEQMVKVKAELRRKVLAT